MKKVLKNVGFTAAGITVGALLWWNGRPILDEAGNVIDQLVAEINRLHGLITGDVPPMIPNPDYGSEEDDAYRPDEEYIPNPDYGQPGLAESDAHHRNQIRQANQDANNLRDSIIESLRALPEGIDITFDAGAITEDLPLPSTPEYDGETPEA